MTRFVRLWGPRWEVELGGGIFMEFVVDQAYCEEIFESYVGRLDPGELGTKREKPEDKSRFSDAKPSLELQKSSMVERI